MHNWAIQSEKAHEKMKKDDQKQTSVDAIRGRPRKSPDSKLELSSFFDNSDIMNSQYDELHPRKGESTALVSFKKSMLESIIKPTSWKNHRNKI